MFTHLERPYAYELDGEIAERKRRVLQAFRTISGGTRIKRIYLVGSFLSENYSSESDLDFYIWVDGFLNAHQARKLSLEVTKQASELPADYVLRRWIKPYLIDVNISCFPPKNDRPNLDITELI